MWTIRVKTYLTRIPIELCFGSRVLVARDGQERALAVAAEVDLPRNAVFYVGDALSSKYGRNKKLTVYKITNNLLKIIQTFKTSQLNTVLTGTLMRSRKPSSGGEGTGSARGTHGRQS